MTYTPAALGFLVGGMLFTGTINTLLNKLQDLTCVENCDAPVESDKKRFEQPLFQVGNQGVTWQMGATSQITHRL